MIKINTSSGETFKLDLNNEEQAKKLVSLLRDYKFQNEITGITVLRKYKRRHRCNNPNCKRISKAICPRCGEIDDGGNFNYTDQYTLVRPSSFGKINFTIEESKTNATKNQNVGEKIICNAGDIQLSIMAYSQQPATRISIQRIGNQRYNPRIEN